MPNLIMLNIVMLNVTMLNVVMLNVVMLSVVAPATFKAFLGILRRKPLEANQKMDTIRLDQSGKSLRKGR